jgi:hypothetical protein
MPKASDDSGEPQARYANYFAVGFNEFEFVLDFGQSYSAQDSRLHTRIVTSPAYAKELLEVLSDAVAEFSRSFGDLPSE